MFGALIKKFVGSRNERVLRRLGKRVEAINAFEPAIEALSDEALKAKTDEFKERIKQGETLDALLPEAFAVVREASKRTLGLRHFDVQMIGGMVLHEGKIAEMRTGEGKTLMATLPAYLNALTGKGVHVVTVNDYLASRDADWMRPIYEFLGLTVGAILANLLPDQRRLAYTSDITYGTNNEFGFDYLRDNMVFSIEEKVQRELHFSIVDEVDSILIDEARTPLIISGQAEDSSELYQKMDKIVEKLVRQQDKDGEGDYFVDEKARQVFLSDAGHLKVEKILEQWGMIKPGDSLYSAANIAFMHHVNSALRAHSLYQNDVDYLVKDNQVVIVDEHTGRTMEGRRWADGLHQAVEAKEGVKIQHENQTLASISFQNYFRLYEKLSGMTGTADTEAYEFQTIYNLEVVVIPTHEPMIRDDKPDQIFLKADEKFAAITEDIKDCQARQQPVLVGTASIEVSEYLSKLLKKEGIKHQVLNAKFHEQEAHIIAQAGRPGAVTIATNMAGRGTDIVLGGNKQAVIDELKDPSQAQIDKIEKEWEPNHQLVLDAGGLRIIGTERHESRRIDNQLRGRSGRQGDQGSSQFYLSLEDNLLRIFAAERMSGLMAKLGMGQGESIAHPWISRSIENAQRKVEGRNFDIRKQLLDYDDVANDQRVVIYKQRYDLLVAEDISDTIKNMRRDVVYELVKKYIPAQSLEEMWDIDGLDKALEADFALRFNLKERLEKDDNLHEENIPAAILESLESVYAKKEEESGAPVLRQFEKALMLQNLDIHWREHLSNMDHLRQGIHLRGYAQKDPKQEYKREAFELFNNMVDNVRYDVVSILSKVQVQEQSEVEQLEAKRRKQAEQHRVYEHADFAEAEAHQDAETPDATVVPFRREEPKVGRNDPCTCGSGKKYKQCCGKLS